MAICWETAVPLAFILCCFYFSAVLIVGVPFPFGVRTGCGIRLYRFLIVAFLSTFQDEFEQDSIYTSRKFKPITQNVLIFC